jgi:hypothetical protein
MEYQKVSFSQIETVVPQKPGLYEIYTNDNVALKVGISINLNKRLLQHFASRQNALKLRVNGDWSNPSDVTSKSSILAKHLYFSKIPTSYDLKSEQGRRDYLESNCYVLFLVTGTRKEARVYEKKLEAEGKFKFVGKAKLPY